MKEEESSEHRVHFDEETSDQFEKKTKSGGIQVRYSSSSRGKGEEEIKALVHLGFLQVHTRTPEEQLLYYIILYYIIRCSVTGRKFERF